MGEGHYFETHPAVGSRRVQVELSLPDFHAQLNVDRGVFSATRVDDGTVHLLKETPVPPQTGDLLDLGCGYGPIACTLAHRAPGANVWAVDVNERALGLTADNATELGLPGIRTATPDGVPSDIRFAGIWSNPPIRVGKAALHDLLSTWLPRLDDAAAAWLVVQRHLGADSLAGWLQQGGWNVTRVASKQGYRILKVFS